MSRRLMIFGGIGLAVVVVAVVAFAYLTRPLADASEDVQDTTERLDTDTQATVFRIDPQQSTAEFNIEEVLNGQDTLVEGTTNQIAGDIRVNFSNPADSEVGEIRINARTFETDNSRRDSAIGRFILQSERDEYEFIEFQPTELSGLPESANVGDTLEFQIIGDLTITGTTREVTFDTNVTYDSEDQISGTAQTTVLYQDFDLTIPEVPIVASVEDDVTLIFDFVATRVEGDPDATEEPDDEA